MPNEEPNLDARLNALSPALRAPVEGMIARRPQLAGAASALIDAYEAIARSQVEGGCLYLCGNGGSMADAIHISAELLKSYVLTRPLAGDLRARLAAAGPDGKLLGDALEGGLRAMVLGLNHSLSSALARAEWAIQLLAATKHVVSRFSLASAARLRLRIAALRSSPRREPNWGQWPQHTR